MIIGNMQDLDCELKASNIYIIRTLNLDTQYIASFYQELSFLLYFVYYIVFVFKY